MLMSEAVEYQIIHRGQFHHRAPFWHSQTVPQYVTVPPPSHLTLTSFINSLWCSPHEVAYVQFIHGNMKWYFLYMMRLRVLLYIWQKPHDNIIDCYYSIYLTICPANWILQKHPNSSEKIKTSTNNYFNWKKNEQGHKSFCVILIDSVTIHFQISMKI